MTVVVKELQESRQIISDDGHEMGLRSFAIYDDGTGSPIITPEMLGPLYGTSTTPDALPATAFPFPGYPQLLANKGAIGRAPGHKDLWIVTFEYHGAPTLEWSHDYTSETIDVWRLNPGLVFPNNGNLGSNITVSTGGTSQDMAGEPISFAVSKQTFEVIEYMFFGGLLVSPTRAISDKTQIYGSFVNRRNSQLFFGCSPGTLVYLGAKARRIGLFRVSVTHTFVWDVWFHLRQIPLRDVGGDVIPADPSNSNWTAKTVYWRQPFPDVADFRDLSPNFLL